MKRLLALAASVLALAGAAHASDVTYPQLNNQITVQDTDLLAVWRATGPLAKVSASVLSGYVVNGLGKSTFLQTANNLSELTATAATARSNLLLGTAATQNTGTSGAVVPLLNGNNTWSGTETFNAAVTFGLTTTHTGLATFNGGITDNGNLTVTGTTTHTGLVTLNGGLTVSTGGANITGASTFQSGLTVVGQLSPSTTNGIKGTTSADNANAGSLGEYVILPFSGVGLTTGVAANVMSTPLSAGDWEVCAQVTFSTGAASSMTEIVAGISTSSGAFPAQSAAYYQLSGINFGSSNSATAPIVPSRINISTTTTVYLVGEAIFAGSATAAGYLQARRVR